MNVDCSDLVFNLRRPEVNSVICAAVNGVSAAADFGFIVVVVVVVCLGLGLAAWSNPLGTTGGIVNNLDFWSVFTKDSKSWLIASVVLHKPG